MGATYVASIAPELENRYRGADIGHPAVHLRIAKELSPHSCEDRGAGLSQILLRISVCTRGRNTSGLTSHLSRMAVDTDSMKE